MRNIPFVTDVKCVKSYFLQYFQNKMGYDDVELTQVSVALLKFWKNCFCKG